MYTYESGKRPAHPADRAHDYLAEVAREACSDEDLAAAVRVLTAMTDREPVLRPLRALATWDRQGNAILDTPRQELHWATYCEAAEWIDRLEHVRDALAQARLHPLVQVDEDGGS